ncbi:type II toxin-antitoxin system HicB family antitoxin [Atopobacter sp. AH10]|uniref:type II toxin-antitoxin system HicB family antitoxin n=1 Tax=Atopobacter sp. AH10 TaxID=2315861 RepID=UPI000EF23B22|nr:type II toxin-antitoxin system HicB family antitoxin [Atopobacter sp. AH10]RLK63138.1 type II toxin-antitoxin system HicB family antitoxin [Atopobacter sp. AH10]
MEKIIYPCLISEDDGVYYVDFPDFESCFTDGDTFEEAVINAKDVLEATLFSLAKNGRKFPKASLEITSDESKKVIYVDIWLKPIMDRANNQSIKKTLTIPKWLNDIAEKQSVNFSSILQTALKEELGIK